jgi:UDP-N-acetylmuramoyl-tripeptide--D-alanyl-D-alanine ligase
LIFKASDFQSILPSADIIGITDLSVDLKPFYDSRAEPQGGLFIALKGENFDGHSFVEKLNPDKTMGILVSKDFKVPSKLEKKLVIKVDDTLLALQQMASWVRKKKNPKLIGITGSNGKSTTKEFATTLVSSQYETLSPKGSFNNHFGVPFTLLELENQKAAVIEMGMNHPGEIKTLVQIADPDCVVVTTVGRAHLEHLGSIEGVAKAKEEIYEFSKKETVRVFNLDNPFTKRMFEKYRRNSSTLTFSSVDPGADVHFKETVSRIDFLGLKGKIGSDMGEVQVPVFGRHNITNLMAASACALGIGIRSNDIWGMLPKCSGIWGRGQSVKLASGATAIFDAYNANPDSFKALFENVARMKHDGKLFGVFGEMLEMGEEKNQLHFELGRQASDLPFETIIFQGGEGESFSAGLKAGGFSKKLVLSDTYKNNLAIEIASVLKPGDIILIKGSRGNKLERILVDLSPVDFVSK